MASIWSGSGFSCRQESTSPNQVSSGCRNQHFLAFGLRFTLRHLSYTPFNRRSCCSCRFPHEKSSNRTSLNHKNFCQNPPDFLYREYINLRNLRLLQSMKTSQRHRKKREEKLYRAAPTQNLRTFSTCYESVTFPFFPSPVLKRSRRQTGLSSRLIYSSQEIECVKTNIAEVAQLFSTNTKSK